MRKIIRVHKTWERRRFVRVPRGGVFLLLRYIISNSRFQVSIFQLSPTFFHSDPCIFRNGVLQFFYRSVFPEFSPPFQVKSIKNERFDYCTFIHTPFFPPYSLLLSGRGAEWAKVLQNGRLRRHFGLRNRGERRRYSGRNRRFARPTD